ncbi:MAG: hypothetical protein B7X99_01260 [Rhizobiales bacterium 17-65-6]|nr:MAG: hypothetical protein B7X99_01260 [Rhizobiales bacterium 17-65-6]
MTSLPPAPPDTGRFYFRAVDDTLFVFDDVSETAHLLNAAAGRLFLSLSSTSVAPEHLAEQASAGPGWRDCLARWTDFGWIARDGSGRVRLRDRPARDGEPQAPSGAGAEQVIAHSRVRLAGRSFDIRLLAATDDGAVPQADQIPAERLAAALRVMAFLDGFADPMCWPGSPPPDDGLDLILTPQATIVRCGPRILRTTDEAIAAGKLRLWLLDLAYRDPRPAILIHGAALALPAGAVVLAGVSGAGKSTLSAALVARGWRFGTDDSVALGFAEGRARVLPCPGAISLKAGSLAPLALFHPGLAALPLVGAGTKQGRYLALPPHLHLSGRGAESDVLGFIFPRFVAGAPTRVEALSPSQALLGLMEAEFDIGEAAGNPELDAFLDLVETVPRHAVTYGDLGEMDATLRDLLADAAVQAPAGR